MKLMIETRQERVSGRVSVSTILFMNLYDVIWICSFFCNLWNCIPLICGCF